MLVEFFYFIFVSVSTICAIVIQVQTYNDHVCSDLLQLSQKGDHTSFNDKLYK